MTTANHYWGLLTTTTTRGATSTTSLGGISRLMAAGGKKTTPRRGVVFSLSQLYSNIFLPKLSNLICCGKEKFFQDVTDVTKL